MQTSKNMVKLAKIARIDGVINNGIKCKKLKHGQISKNHKN